MEPAAFFQAKKAGRKTRARKGLTVKPNGRSADFIIPSFAIGCELGCSYCYVARHRAFGNPLELMTNREEIWAAVLAHYEELPPKSPNQTDPARWVYDIGESTDCLSPQVAETTRWFIRRFLEETDAKPGFATKVVRPDWLENVSQHFPNQARVRVSLMPQPIAQVVESGTSRIDRRIAAMNGFLARGYEVHVNFSPVIAYRGWTADYRQLFREMDQTLDDAVKAQLKAEVIFLTHHEGLHNANLTWSPEAEDYLWTPQWQERKTNQRGDADVLRYKARRVKPELQKAFHALLEEELPDCPIRYIF